MGGQTLHTVPWGSRSGSSATEQASHWTALPDKGHLGALGACKLGWLSSEVPEGE